ncbi:hypothetical protein [Streptomyces sp. NRRL F-5727]|uniref:hypothetical protein n=1 Tax=Streptomyces sp. NRRL F-5727 TaxID=1463871 RepID=UPI0018FE660D|nr:hypothetical protein [Streptomyces sp. NRRL F-5727]
MFDGIEEVEIEAVAAAFGTIEVAEVKSRRLAGPQGAAGMLSVVYPPITDPHPPVSG